MTRRRRSSANRTCLLICLSLVFTADTTPHPSLSAFPQAMRGVRGKSCVGQGRQRARAEVYVRRGTRRIRPRPIEESEDFVSVGGRLKGRTHWYIVPA